MAYVSFLVTDFTIALITFMVSALHEGPTLSTTSPALTDSFLVRRAMFVVRETRVTTVMTITPCARNSEFGEIARVARHTIATCLVTAMCGITRARFVTCITIILNRHRVRYIHDHVIVLFDVIVQQIEFLGGVELPFENYV